MASFKKVCGLTLKNEAGYNNASMDKGGQTYAGISRVYHNDWPGWEYVDAATKAAGVKHLDPSREERKTIDVLLSQVGRVTELIEEFYKKEFWDVLKLDLVDSDRAAWKIFDMAVNLGTGRAAKFVQRVLGLHEDGIVGMLTVTAINSAYAATLIDKLCELQASYYRSRVIEDPSQEVFLTGWLDRAAQTGSEIT